MKQFAPSDFLLGRWLGMLLAVACVAGVVAGLAWHEWPAQARPLFNRVLPVQPGGKVGELLLLERAGLYRVDLALTRQESTVGQVRLLLTLDSAGQLPVVSATACAAQAEDVSWAIRRPYTFVAFRFPPLSDLPAGRVWLWLESKANQPFALRYLKRPSASTSASKTGVSDEYGGTWARRVYYVRSWTENLALFAARFTGWRTGLWRNSWLYGGLLALYASLVGALFPAMDRKGEKGKKHGMGGQDAQERHER